VPAIIAYSNQFYDGFMQPLRIPKESERIDPPLVDIYVPSGYRGNKDINRPEAEAIADEITAILQNKQFANRTLGVVSLLGPDQAKFIDTLVRSRCDASELMRRKFECGDARVFQGSERDIMFLTMVVDPKNARAASGNTAEQRFNVAGSRARDRMYLVRSVKLTDLSHLDLRAGLLGHFSKPSEGSYEENKNLIELCESGFEKQVYSELVEKGYRVIPQVKAGSFRIDMVVEGERDARLAIECDGDEFHGPDRWAADMGRQRVLERAGWTFWRCFASTWSMRRDEVFEELLQRLSAMGIEPLGTLEKIPSLVEQRTWIPSAQINSDSGQQVDDVGVEIEAAIATAQASTQDLFATEVQQPIAAEAPHNPIS
jgi:very-short-patch-repair endonuclease